MYVSRSQRSQFRHTVCVVQRQLPVTMLGTGVPKTVGTGLRKHGLGASVNGSVSLPLSLFSISFFLHFSLHWWNKNIEECIVAQLFLCLTTLVQDWGQPNINYLSSLNQLLINLKSHLNQVFTKPKIKYDNYMCRFGSMFIGTLLRSLEFFFFFIFFS